MADQVNGNKPAAPLPGDHVIPPVRMDQCMSIAAHMVASFVGSFRKTDQDTSEDLTNMHLTCVAIFLHELLRPAVHKDKIVKILKALIIELENAPAQSHVPNPPA